MNRHKLTPVPPAEYKAKFMAACKCSDISVQTDSSVHAAASLSQQLQGFFTVTSSCKTVAPSGVERPRKASANAAEAA